EITTMRWNDLPPTALSRQFFRALHEVVHGAVAVQYREQAQVLNIATLARHTGMGANEMIGTISLFGFPVVHHRIRETADVPGGDPRLWVLDDCRVNPDHLDRMPVRSDRRALDHVPPP